jgi:opacity protein-like surface antigen
MKGRAMVSVRLLLGAGAASLMSAATFAADMPQPPQYQPPPMMYVPQPVVMEQPMGTWYLRGDVGIGAQTFSEFNHTQTNSTFVWPASWEIVQQDIQDTTIFGVGVGYQFNSWFRTDLTAEYRTKAMFKATGSYTNFCSGGGTCFDVTEGNLSSAVVMANIYLDLGTWWCLTPYIGVGVGGAYNRITGIQDNGINSDGSVGFGLSSTDSAAWNAAWNVQTGLTYNVNNNFKVDLNLRYLHLGSPETAEVVCQNTASCPGAFYTLTDVSSWDFRIGVRWMLQPEAQPAMMPQPMQVPMQMQMPMQMPMQAPMMPMQMQPPMQAPMPLMSRG